MAGRRPIPTNLKIIKGTDQPCRMNENEPKPPSDGIKMPVGLSKDAKKHWRVTSKVLKDANVMTVMDVDALRLYCETAARYFEANRKLEQYGMVVKTPGGHLAQSPYLQVVNKCEEQMRKMLIEFGMTPSSRTRVSTVGEKKKKTTFGRGL